MAVEFVVRSDRISLFRRESGPENFATNVCSSKAVKHITYPYRLNTLFSVH